MKSTVVVFLSLLIAGGAFAGLQPGSVVPAGEPFPIVADFDRDGLDDLIQGRNVLLNDTGSFAVARDLALPEYEDVVGVLDVNADGRLDLLTLYETPLAPPSVDPGGTQERRYQLRIADASMTYADATFISPGWRPFIADVEGDGDDDILIAEPVFVDRRVVGCDMTVLRSRGDGTFDTLPSFRIPNEIQGFDHRLQWADLNHDGMPDLVVRTPQELVVMLGTGRGRFDVRSRYLPQGDEFGVMSTRVGDVDGDSHADVVIAGFRSVRVFFNDGRANFPRVAAARTAKVHDIENFPAGVPLNADAINCPRNLILGHFTRRGPMQIAAGTTEGDIVVLSYEAGALREVSRSRTEFWLPELRGGNFDTVRGTDLYVMGTLIWGEMYPRPRIFNGSGDLAAGPEVGRAARRAVIGRRAGTALRMTFDAECVTEAPDRWAFARDGIFGVAQQGDSTIEAVFDGGSIFFRLTAPYTVHPATGRLRAVDGEYRGIVDVLTPCGRKTMTITGQWE